MSNKYEQIELRLTEEVSERLQAVIDRNVWRFGACPQHGTPGDEDGRCWLCDADEASQRPAAWTRTERLAQNAKVLA